MAHFFRPRTETPDGYHVDGKLAPDSVWKLDIRLGRTRKIGLLDGTGGAGLSVKSNNNNVVPNDGFKEHRDGPNRYLTLYGQRPGTSLLEVRQGTSYWFCLQIEVSGGGEQKGKWVRAARRTMVPIRQPRDVLCWAACFRMLYMWKGLDPNTVDDKLKAAGIDVDTAYLVGLWPRDNATAAKALGMNWVSFAQSITAYDLRSHLLHSPLWVAGQWSRGSLHVRVVTGASEDKVEFMDPWPQGTDLEDTDLIHNFVHGDGHHVHGTDTSRVKGSAQILYWRA